MQCEICRLGLQCLRMQPNSFSPRTTTSKELEQGMGVAIGPPIDCADRWAEIRQALGIGLESASSVVGATGLFQWPNCPRTTMIRNY